MSPMRLTPYLFLLAAACGSVLVVTPPTTNKNVFPDPKPKIATAMMTATSADQPATATPADALITKVGFPKLV